MKKILILLFFILPYIARAQIIANTIEVLGPDSFKFYFKSNGNLIDKEFADFYRLAKLNNKGFVFDGPCRDYYISGKIFSEVFYSNNLFDGAYKLYYDNGVLREQGTFKNGEKQGEWKYWFPNGNLERVILFDSSTYYVKQVYKSNGKPLVQNGQGKFIANDLLFNSIIKGEIKNGKQHGEWTSNIKYSGDIECREYFDNGKFIKGKSYAFRKNSNGEYIDNSRLFIDIVNTIIIDIGTKEDFLQLKGKRSFNFLTYQSNYDFLSFYDRIYQNFEPPYIESGYVIIGYTINKNGNLVNTQIYNHTGFNEINDSLLAIFSNSGKWNPSKTDGFPQESTLLCIFQFLNGHYKILSDSRNETSKYINTLDSAANWKLGNQTLTTFLLTKIQLPDSFYYPTFNLNLSYEFYIDDKGNFCTDDRVFNNRLTVTTDEKILYNSFRQAMVEAGKWSPAYKDGLPAAQGFNSVIKIRNGVADIKFMSKNWVVKDE